MAGVCTQDGPCVTTPVGTGRNWVTKAGGDSAYVHAIVHALMRAGRSEADAERLAHGILHRWARGQGHVTPATRARAARALAHWNEIRARAHTHDHALEARMTVDLADSMMARLAPDRAALIRLAKKVEAWPAGPKRTAMKKRIKARAKVLHVQPDGDNDFDMDVPRKGADLAVPTALRAKARRADAASGKALPGGRFPIPDVTYLHKAIRAVGRAKGDHSQVRRYIIKRARQLGAEGAIPKGWKPDGTLTLRSRVTGRGK